MQQHLLRLLVAVILFSVVPTVLSEFSSEGNAHRHWHRLMEGRRPFQKQINPHEHFAHIFGDVHVLMQAGEKYASKFTGLDAFGSPLMYRSHLNPRYHIFNSDFDSKIKDVYVEDSRVLIRTTHPDHMLNLKIRKGHVFSTAVDWTLSEDEVHEGSLDLLITEDPILISPDVIMLENVVRMDFSELWNFADVHIDAQNYQYTSPNGSMEHRAAPITYTVHDLEERDLESNWYEENEIDGRFWKAIKKLAAPVVNVVRQVATTVVKTVTAVVQAVVAVVTGGEQMNSFNFSFNYDSNTRKASREIPIYSFSRSATVDNSDKKPPAAGQKPKPEGVSASVSASISLDVTCVNCYGLATFRTETRFKVSLTSKPSFEYKISGDFTLKSVIEFKIVGKVTATVDVPIGPSFTATDPKASAVSGKAARYDVKAGLYLSGLLEVELTGILTFDVELQIGGYIAAGVRGITPYFESDFSVKKSSFSMKMETEILVKWEIFFGPKLTGSIYDVGLQAATGVAFENELEITPACQRWVKGRDSAIRLRATIDVDLPSLFNNVGISDISKKWVFLEYVVRPLLGCFLDSDPNGPPPVGSKALPAATAVQTEGGQVFSFGELTPPRGEFYSITSSNGQYRYDFNIGSPTYGSPCRGIDVGICQTDISGGGSFLVGRFNRDIVSRDDGSFLMHFRNGDATSCPASLPRQGKIIMVCDRNATTPRPERVQEVSVCSYEIYVKTKEACLEPCAGFVGTRKWDFAPLRDAGPFYYSVNGTAYSVALCGQSVPDCSAAGACAAVPIGTLPLLA